MKKKLIAGALALAMSASILSGCAVNYKTSAELPTWSTDEEFRFAAYMTPPQENVGVGELKDNPNYITDEQWKNLADCGFNYAYAVYEYELEDIKTVLSFCEKYGVKYLVRDSAGASDNISSLIGGENITSVPEDAQAEIKARIDTYKDSPAFAGHIAVDEPAADRFDNIAVVKDFYEEYLPGKEFYVNLFPEGGATGTETYDEYLDQFIEKVEPEFLSYDRYALTYDTSRNPELGLGYVKNLEDVAVRAKQHNIPFYVFLLTMGHWNYRTPKNYDYLAWQIYNSMAYGARGLETFTYWTTMSTGENITYGLIDWYGNKTQTWYSMQELISEIKAMEDVYLSFNWQNTVCYTADSDFPNYQYEGLRTSVLCSNEAEAPIEGVGHMSADHDVLLGHFKDAEGRNGYMLTNIGDPANDQTVTAKLTFEGADEVLVYKKGRAVRYALNKGVFTTEVGSGEGQFIVPITA